MEMAPWKRITAEEALRHSFLEVYHDPRTEPNCSEKVITLLPIGQAALVPLKKFENFKHNLDWLPFSFAKPSDFFLPSENRR